MLLLRLTIVLSFFSTTIQAQIVKKINLNPIETSIQTISSLGTPQIQASSYKLYTIDIASLRYQLEGIGHVEYENNGFVGQISLPHPDGSKHTYLVKENYTMDPILGVQYPEIKTYDAYSEEDGSSVKLDVTPHGFHAMIMIPGKSAVFIDPIIKGNTEYYIVYSRKDFITDKTMECLVDNLMKHKEGKPSLVKSFGDCTLRTYRLALAATGEYTAYHGGTVALALAAQNTSMNRINGVYEREMSIRMNLVANNNLIIYTNATTDPYTNNNGATMLGQNQTTCTNVIGSANYDIGHVFSTGGGGIAQLQSPCSSGNKAKGVTGSPAPIGDPFDIDYVAHEMGHQFGANHTFNSSNGGSCAGNANAATSFEPGSGTTIMAYAGICAPVNVQNNSDDYFHTISLQEIGAFVTGASHTCPVESPLSNTAPSVAPVPAISIPQGTPFFLTASATDVNPANVLTYCWEEKDAGTSTTAPTATQTTKANFRSFDPTTSPTRYFPSLAALAANGPYTWEVLPTVARTMNFQVTVRDNAAGGGCNDESATTVAVIATSGPFAVTYPTATGISWAGSSSQTVTWNVVNTTAAPISCANVDILLSTDGGLTYPTVLASNVPNDGSQVITVPNTASTTCRIMVRCSGGYFFDISNNNFTITAPTSNYTLSSTPSTLSVCQPSNAVFTVNVGSIGGYTTPVTLSITGVPAGATSAFSTNPVTPVGTSTLTISNTALAAPGTYTLTITGNSATGTQITTVQLTIANGAPSAITLLTPLNTATGVSVPTAFTWSTSAGSGITYDIQIATDAGFAAIVDQSTGLSAATYTSSILSTSTTYYWRVRVVSGCGNSPWSSTFSFGTNTCSTTASTVVPVAISASGTPTVTSTITIPTGGTITDVNVLNLVGTHTYMSDLTVTLTSPLGTSVVLFAGICTTLDNFNLNFDGGSASTYASIPCPPTSAGTYQPSGNLSLFNGQNSTGVWTLTIADGFDVDGGSLASWSLNICVNPPCSPPATPVVTVTNNCGNSVLTTTGTNLLWSTGATTPSITVTAAGSYTVTQTVAGCVSAIATGTAAPLVVPSAPIVSVVNNCGNSVISATGTNLLWSTGASTPSITVTSAGAYTVTQTVGGCNSVSGSITATPLTVPTTPIVTVVNNCGNSVLTTSGSNLLWSTGGSTPSITVSSAGSYTVTQTIGGCISASGSITASPLPLPIITQGTISLPTSCGALDGTFGVNGTGTGTVSWSGPVTSSAPSVLLPYTISGLSAGTYSITFNNGCNSNVLSTLLLDANAPMAPVVSVVNNCGNSVLTATGSNLLWSNGSTSSSNTVTSAGTFTVTQSAGGCISAPSTVVAAPLTVPSVSLSAFNDVCINAPSFVLTGGTPTGGTYSGTGVSTNVFNPSVAGYGAFIITYTYTAGNGCSATNQNPITVGCAGAEEETPYTFAIFPNPTDGKFIVEAGNELITTILIHDAAGRLVKSIENQVGNQKVMIDLTSYSSGTYSIQIMTSKTMFRDRLILTK